MPASSAETAPVFRLCGAGFQYEGGVVALQDITFDVASGEKIAILGANGSGKSTLIKMLDGLLFPTGGSIEAFGRPITEEALKSEREAQYFRRRVGFIFQNSDAQLFSPTVREEIAFGPLQMGFEREEVESRLRDVVRLLGIERLLDRPPFHLSGGEKKKVAIASTLVINPDVLLLDEPTNGLDPRSQRWLIDLLVSLHAAGKTLITATHDLEMVPEIADRVLVFGEDHRIAASGATADILADGKLLLHVNLVHERWHRHGNIIHSHPHFHDHVHDPSHPQADSS